jgi:hypothetical protein
MMEMLRIAAFPTKSGKYRRNTIACGTNLPTCLPVCVLTSLSSLRYKREIHMQRPRLPDLRENPQFEEKTFML